MKATLKEHSAAIGALAINIVATVYAVFNPIVAKELFTLYGVTTAGLYGYSQQARFAQQSFDDSRREGGSGELPMHSSDDQEN
jgi:hypothetical protein